MQSSRQLVVASIVLTAVIGVGLMGNPASAQRKLAPRLFPVELRQGFESVRIEGSDPSGPRRLVLWIIQDDETRRLAQTHSTRSGRFDFGQIAVPSSGLVLEVSPDGETPSRRAGLRIPGVLRPPRIRAASPADGFSEVEIIPARAEGEIRIHDADSGRLRLRVAIEPEVRQGFLLDFFDLLSPDVPSAIRIHQVDGKGNQSDATYWNLMEDASAAPATEETGR